jgi:hypothetical protein
LRSEKAEEFTKGLERAWSKHFGLPKVLRIDEAKNWSSKHVREWAASRGIEIEVQPAESHSWLSVVERKHQVICDVHWNFTKMILVDMTLQP